MRTLIDLIESDSIEFIFESPADDIITSLESTPFNDTIRKTGNTVHVLVPISQRQQAIRQLTDLLPDAMYDPHMSGSSIGGIVYKGGKIIIKPTGKQGEASAGVANEMELFNVLTEMSKRYSQFTVEFKAADGKIFKIDNAVGVEHSGKEVTGRLKGDVRIVTKDTKHPISIKKISADVWESADSYYGPTAFNLLHKLQKSGKVELQGLGKFNKEGTEYVKVVPEVAVEPTPQEMKDVIFGEDIQALDGAVIIQTFAPQHFVQEEDYISIECEHIIKSIDDIPRSHLMVWLIRNDSTRNPTGGIPGLRITAAVQTRAFGKHGTKTPLYVSRDGKELENPLADVAEKYLKDKEEKAASKNKQAAIQQKIADIDKPTTGIRPPGTVRAPRDATAAATQRQRR